MPLTEKIQYLHEPTDLQCGQAVLAMLSGIAVDKIAEMCGTQKETTLADMKRVLGLCGIAFDSNRKEAKNKADLPEIALLSLETPRCWHWSLYAFGVFYDPEHGVLEDFPLCKRKYFWEIKNNT